MSLSKITSLSVKSSERRDPVLSILPISSGIVSTLINGKTEFYFPCLFPEAGTSEVERRRFVIVSVRLRVPSPDGAEGSLLIYVP